jgi:hypothetical protein
MSSSGMVLSLPASIFVASFWERRKIIVALTSPTSTFAASLADRVTKRTLELGTDFDESATANGTRWAF